MIGNNEAYQVQPLTASGLVKRGSGVAGGIICASSTSGTIALYDGVDNTGTKILDTTALAAGSPIPFPVQFTVGLYAFITGTASVSVLYT